MSAATVTGRPSTTRIRGLFRAAASANKPRSPTPSPLIKRLSFEACGDDGVIFHSSDIQRQSAHCPRSGKSSGSSGVPDADHERLGGDGDRRCHRRGRLILPGATEPDSLLSSPRHRRALGLGRMANFPDLPRHPKLLIHLLADVCSAEKTRPNWRSDDRSVESSAGATYRFKPAMCDKPSNAGRLRSADRMARPR
jgi:hypothetical protein